MGVRAAREDDLPALSRVVDATGLFPGEMLAGMMRPYLDGSDQSFWLTFEDGDAIGVVFVEPERMTAGTWNQLLVAVHPDRQGQGVGAQLLTAVERRVAQDLGGHLLLVETSADPAFDGTRRFYERLRYQRLAAIDDFYRPGEGKVIYGKRL